MKKIFLVALLALALQFKTFAQDNKPAACSYVQITTVESVIAGGMGRSKMLITKDDGTTEEKDLENLFSMVGINFKNIKENENSIIVTLKRYTDDGWKLVSVSPLTLSPGSSSNGIFMTRYLLTKEKK